MMPLRKVQKKSRKNLLSDEGKMSQTERSIKEQIRVTLKRVLRIAIDRKSNEAAFSYQSSSPVERKTKKSFSR